MSGLTVAMEVWAHNYRAIADDGRETRGYVFGPRSVRGRLILRKPLMRTNPRVLGYTMSLNNVFNFAFNCYVNYTFEMLRIT